MGTGGSAGAGGSLGGSSATSGSGGAGNGGSGGAAGSVPIDVDESVLQRGKNDARTAHFIQPSLTMASMNRMAMDVTFKATFSGNMEASPLFVASTTPGRGLFFAATTKNDIYALDETTGAVVWHRNLGAAGHGIRSTPVIDAGGRAIFVAGDFANPTRHEIHALSVDTGSELPGGWPVDASKIVSSDNVTFNSPDQNQRSALSLVNGVLYVAFGGYFGDGGNYHGWVIAVDTKNPKSVVGWSSKGSAEGIWAAGGMASDGNGVFAITGNSHSAHGDHTNSDGEEVLRITDMAVPHRDKANLFYPDIWNSMDSSDKDFGSCSPLVLAVPGSTPSTLLVAPAKPGHVYFLDVNNLGGLAGQLRDLVVAATNAESVYTAPTAYTTDTGVHVAITTTIGAACPGGAKNSQLLSILLHPGSPPAPQIMWCATTSDDDEIRRRSPISTTSDGHSNAIVWFMNGSKLNAFDGNSGAPLYQGGTDLCGGVRRHTSPIAARGRIVVGADGHLCSWSAH